MQINDRNYCRELGIDADELSQSQLLRFCVYSIEKQSNFTGHGFRTGEDFTECQEEEYEMLIELESFFKK